MSFSYFDESDLLQLEAAYRNAIAELGIPTADEAVRLRIAQLVMEIAKVESVIVPSWIGHEAARRFLAELGSLMPLIPAEDRVASLLDPMKRSS